MKFASRIGKLLLPMVTAPAAAERPFELDGEKGLVDGVDMLVELYKGNM